MRRVLLISLLTITTAATASPLSSLRFASLEGTPEKTSTETPEITVTEKIELPITSPNQNVRQALLSEGKALIGTPYRWGGTTPRGFDCSGFVQYLYKQKGFRLPRTSRAQFAELTPVDAPKPGDLVFFRRGGRINHVGMYIGEGKMIHSPQSGSSIRIESMEKPNWQRRYAGARSIIHAAPLPQSENSQTPMLLAEKTSLPSAKTSNAFSGMRFALHENGKTHKEALK